MSSACAGLQTKSFIRAVWQVLVHNVSLTAPLGTAGRSDAVLQDVAFRLHQLTDIHSESAIAFGDCLASARRLGASRLLLTESGGKRLLMKLSLNVPLEDVTHVLHSESSIPWLKHLNF